MSSATLVTHDLMAAAADVHTSAARVLADGSLDAPTPCTDWDVRGLVRPLAYWSPVLAATGRRRAPRPPAAEEGAVEVGDGWVTHLQVARDDLVAAWSDPGAWSGTVSMGGPDELPAPMIGGMVFGELVLHGWDLTRSAGLAPTWPDEVLIAALPIVEGMAEEGRRMGIFGPRVAVPPGSDLLDRVVAASGRDPRWSPGQTVAG
jgi:uncharacterized protein (TIGR03086 family)